MALRDDERPADVTRKAQGACFSWLTECRRIGWPKDALDDLERLWWKYHDRKGELIPAPERAAEPQCNGVCEIGVNRVWADVMCPLHGPQEPEERAAEEPK